MSFGLDQKAKAEAEPAQQNIPTNQSSSEKKLLMGHYGAGLVGFSFFIFHFFIFHFSFFIYIFFLFDGS